jgi:predicted phosphohydrolase
MAEVKGNNQYIYCSSCKCRYINDAEHIKNDFGFTRLEVQYKTCVKCRGWAQKSREKKLKEEVEQKKLNDEIEAKRKYFIGRKETEC